ncbi:F-box/kelch-repeat protein At3g27150 [Ziziphus jujuba]|uniref:F-box/kelch-repeat protein At3g27150 n=2 Tax=Ziziphus jujuba TaxID=326968 RepID=A0A6P4AGR8_ZIZJJ|nr:F-box/kelch-repeat protein At3g27150 [Ziziphus jujuba]XP_015893820.1 F-box/kelch-repeat protein At3g27150 [Ziziphus jujuba]XP_015893821.1 F-box/kelch-repeat protein At3g27150 [Ziziphus jujuba]XP_015893822.1 F-box/kelch-repeat protein At3g27150 [Ziziphus jujuba]KAH7518893.1 hypothetical protein FEM48_Zijuj09G0219400 [Ziziphus jujuba var. spinosa]
MFNLKEEERDYLCKNDCTSFWVTSQSATPSEKIRVVSETNLRLGLNSNVYSSKNGNLSGSPTVEPQDADYKIPRLIDEVEDLILSRVPRSDYGNVCLVSKRYLSLLKSGQLFRIRNENGLAEPSVFVLANNETSWWTFDRKFKSARKLPILPSTDGCFNNGDKESLCAGTHLLVLGRELEGSVIWRYQLASNRWSKAPSMINSRCMFASATCGNFGYIAGGNDTETYREILNSAEKYNPESGSWERLPNMHKKRRASSGCFMDNKFFVIGGNNKEEGNLKCAEAFDVKKNTWEWIPNMLENLPVIAAQSPPLVAVVNNQLYYLEHSNNELMVYLKNTKSWKNLGSVPVRADLRRGWGVAFKSLGNELLVIGASTNSNASHSMTVYSCSPDPDATQLHWNPLQCGLNELNHFIKNCSVMIL